MSDAAPSSVFEVRARLGRDGARQQVEVTATSAVAAALKALSLLTADPPEVVDVHSVIDAARPSLVVSIATSNASYLMLVRRILPQPGVKTDGSV